MQQYRLDFLFALIKRKLIERYIGSLLELLWVFISPLVPLLTNLFIFFYLAKVPQITGMGLVNYMIFVFTGLLPYRLVQKAVSEGCDLILNNIEFLKNVNVPLFFFGIVSLGGLLFEFFIQFLLLFSLLLFSEVGFSSQFFLLPLALFLFSLFVLGITWSLSILGYLLKDVQEILNVAFMGLLYLTPIMYPLSLTHGIVNTLIRINPLTQMVIIFRDVLLPDAGGIHVMSWLIFALLAISSFITGYIGISKTQRFVGDLV